MTEQASHTMHLNEAAISWPGVDRSFVPSAVAVTREGAAGESIAMPVNISGLGYLRLLLLPGLVLIIGLILR